MIKNGASTKYEKRRAITIQQTQLKSHVLVLLFCFCSVRLLRSSSHYLVIRTEVMLVMSYGTVQYGEIN